MGARWRTARLLLLISGATLLAILVSQNDPEAILHSIRQLGWRILIVIAFPFTIVNVLDTLGWRFAFRRDLVPFGALFSARLAGEAFNLTTPTASVGGEAVKAWLIRHHVPLDEALAVGGFVAVQVGGVLGFGGRALGRFAFLERLAGGLGRLDDSLAVFY